jgi:hypothetical protein
VIKEGWNGHLRSSNGRRRRSLERQVVVIQRGLKERRSSASPFERGLEPSSASVKECRGVGVAACRRLQGLKRSSASASNKRAEPVVGVKWSSIVVNIKKWVAPVGFQQRGLKRSSNVIKEEGARMAGWSSFLSIKEATVSSLAPPHELLVQTLNHWK